MDSTELFLSELNLALEDIPFKHVARVNIFTGELDVQLFNDFTKEYYQFTFDNASITTKEKRTYLIAHVISSIKRQLKIIGAYK